MSVTDPLRLHKDRAAQLLARGRLAAALESYRAASRLAPRDWAVRQRGGEVLERLGRTSEAVLEYEAVARALAEDGQLLRAIALCKRILSLRPRHTETQRMLARLYARRRERSPVEGMLAQLLQQSASGRAPQRALPARLALPMLGPAAGAADADARASGAGGEGPVAVAQSTPDAAAAHAAAATGEDAAAAATPWMASAATAMARALVEAVEAMEAAALEVEAPVQDEAGAPSADAAAAGGVELVLPAGDAPDEEPLPRAALGLPTLPLFGLLSREEFLAVLEGLELRACFDGERVVTEGEAGDSAFAIVEGTVDVVRHLRSDDGAEELRTVATLGEGDVFGEMALVGAGPRLASVVARGSHTLLLELPRTRMDAIVARHPQVAEVLQAFYRERLVENLVRSSPLFARLPPARRQAVSASLALRQVEGGVRVLTQGARAEGLYLLLRGRCVPFHTHPDGRVTDYPALREGDVFGEVALLLGQPVSAGVRTEGPCTLLFLGRDAFFEHLDAEDDVRRDLMLLATERLQRTVRMLSDG